MKPILFSFIFLFFRRLLHERKQEYWLLSLNLSNLLPFAWMKTFRLVPPFFISGCAGADNHILLNWKKTWFYADDWFKRQVRFVECHVALFIIISWVEITPRQRRRCIKNKLYTPQATTLKLRMLALFCLATFFQYLFVAPVCLRLNVGFRSGSIYQPSHSTSFLSYVYSVSSSRTTALGRPFGPRRYYFHFSLT